MSDKHVNIPKQIEIRGAKVHNLKNVDVDIPCPDCRGSRYSRQAYAVKRIRRMGAPVRCPN